MAKVEIEVYANSGARAGAQFLATDAFGRLRMSAGLVEKLSVRGEACSLYLAFDKANKRIMLGKPGVVKPTDARPVKFDRTRHYAQVRPFFLHNQIPLNRARYVDDGEWNGWMTFRREDFEAADKRATE